jgi:ribosomal protein S17
MPRVTAKTNKRSKKGGLTGSKHFDTPNVESSSNPLETAQNIATKVGETAQNIASKVDAVGNGARSVANGVKSVRQAFTGGSQLVTDGHTQVLGQAKEIASTYGVQLTDIQGHMSASNDTVDDSLGEGISAKEANERKLKIQRQNNHLEVRLERVKQKRKIATLHKEELNLVGDLVEVATTGVQVASKMVNHQIAVTDFKTNQSKLEEHEELLIQQGIRTQGTINLTAGIRTEWDLKYQKQERSNERLVLEIEGAEKSNEQKRLEIEAFLLSE